MRRRASLSSPLLSAPPSSHSARNKALVELPSSLEVRRPTNLKSHNLQLNMREEGEEEEEKENREEDDCLILERNPFLRDDEGDGDCIVLETGPSEETLEAFPNTRKNLRCIRGGSNRGGESPVAEGEQEELLVVWERGEVACRDYPHPRHLCARYPFDESPHERHCHQCYCFVCDIAAPCKYWSGNTEEHCHATELESKWKKMRRGNR